LIQRYFAVSCNGDIGAGMRSPVRVARE
jgi:hypothetical protein